MKEAKAIKIGLIILTSFIVVFFAVTYSLWASNYKDRVAAATSIGNIDFSGKTFSEASSLINERMSQIQSAGITFQYNQKSALLTPDTVSFDSDLSFSALSFDADQTASDVFGTPTERSFSAYLGHLLGLRGDRIIKATYSLDGESVRSFLAENFTELNIAPENAHFSIEKKGISVVLEKGLEKIGKEINYDLAIEEISKNLENLENKNIALKTKSNYPAVKQGDLAGLEPRIQGILERGNFVLSFSDPSNNGTSTKWIVKPEKLITWVGTERKDDVLQISLDREKIKQYLTDSIAPQIDKEPVLPRFEIKNGRVSSWETGKNGRQLDIEANIEEIVNGFLQEENEINLISKELPAQTLTPETNFKIQEIIGTGHSSFTGSSSNRRHNINVGAAALHGLIIKPGEEFSLIKTLGDVSDKTGYLPELVIKGNKTIPEFGGGLCQIGTTVFRTALASGLPITMRQNHSYRVSYYEPAGTDATIYVPRPDFRFVNDTGNYILIQARVSKNDLYFDFWGTKDGRIASTSEPVIYNIVKPEPTKIIESDDLKPGEKKCTESSHNGADAYFDYKVIYPEGATTTQVVEKRFKSHYVPWQGVCLVGKKNASSTNATDQSAATSSKQKATSSIPAASSSKTIKP